MLSEFWTVATSILAFLTCSETLVAELLGDRTIRSCICLFSIILLLG